MTIDARENRFWGRHVWLDIELRQQLLLLLLSLAILLLSLILRIDRQQSVRLPGLDRPLPGTCVFRQLTDQPCPGCGLTRSFISLAHGDLAGSWSFHPVGIALFALVTLQLPYRLYQIVRIARGGGPRRLPRADWLIWVLLVVLLLQWVIRLVS